MPLGSASAIVFTPSGTVVAFIALHTPPRAANAAGLNRHDSFEELLQAWNATGNPAYPTFFSNLVADWVGHLPCREGVSRQGWNAAGGAAPCATGTMESPWRVRQLRQCFDCFDRFGAVRHARKKGNKET